MQGAVELQGNIDCKLDREFLESSSLWEEQRFSVIQVARFNHKMQPQTSGFCFSSLFILYKFLVNSVKFILFKIPRMVFIFLCCCCLVTKLCATLCNPKNCSLPVCSAHGISQTRILEWVDISYSRTEPMSSAWQADSLPLSHQGRI